MTCASETEAETCAPGSFFNATTKKCIACGTNMATCTAVDKALTCDDSFYKNGDACTGCGTN